MRIARRDSPIGFARGSSKQSGLRRTGVHLLLLLLAPPVGAFSQETTFHTQSNVVVIPTLVKDARGEIVFGLTAKDFIVEDDGVEQTVHLDEEAEGQPVSMVVAIQRGRRANYEFPRIRGLSAMLDPLVEEGHEQVAIVGFDSQVRLVQDFSSNSDLIAKNLKELQPGDDGAAILDAVDYSVKLLERTPQQRQRVLLLISETRDHGSHTAKVDEVVAEIGQSRTAVYALAFSPSRSNILDTMRGNNMDEMHPSPDLLAPLAMAVDAMKKNMAKTVASMTGGEYELFATRKSFDSRMIDFTNHVHNRYVLSIEPKNPHAGLHQLRVRLRDPRNGAVLARSSYWVAATQ
ncbi:MAG: VWA domain-containing protein [Candidatus Sulfotelmatobacter sp.]